MRCLALFALRLVIYTAVVLAVVLLAGVTHMLWVADERVLLMIMFEVLVVTAMFIGGGGFER